MNQVFVPKSSGLYFLQGYNNSINTVVIVNEYALARFCSKKWIEIMMGNYITIQSKYEDKISELLQSPIIFISNFEPSVTLLLNLKLNNILERPSMVEIIHSHNDKGNVFF